MGRPGCALEFSGEMLPHEQRFLSWLNSSRSLRAGREQLAEDIGLGRLDVDSRMQAMYRKFRDTWVSFRRFVRGSATGAPKSIGSSVRRNWRWKTWPSCDHKAFDIW